MPADVDPELLIDAILMHVDDLGEAIGPNWLRGEFDRVLEATMSGAEFVTATSFQGASSTATQEVPAQQLLAVLTQARKRLHADANGSPSAAAMLIPRFTEFPLSA